MNRKNIFAAALLLLALSGLGYFYNQARNLLLVPAPAKLPAVLPSPPPTNPRAAAWHRDSKLPWEFDPIAAAYTDPRVGQALQLIDRELGQLALSTPGEQTPKHYPFYYAGDRPGPGYLRKYRAVWGTSGAVGTDPRRPIPRGRFELEFGLYEAQPELNDFQLRCDMGSPDDWNVTWRLQVSPGKLTFITLQLWHSHSPGMVLTLRPGSQEYRYQVGDFNTYSTSWTLNNSTHADYARNVPTTFVALWRSPESFQEAALVELESFDLVIGDWYAAGGQVRKFYPYRGDGTPPEEVVSPTPHRLPLGPRTQLAVQAGTLNMIRRQLVLTHAAEMQQALHESFPAMVELLELFQSP